MITKKINGGNFEPVSTGEIVFDTTPTVNSFNAITSDGVARAVAGASGEVPQVTDQDNGKVLTAVYDEGGAAVEWAEAAGGLPDTTGASQGDVLTVGSSGPEWAAAPTELPASLGTAGQVLTVNSGATGVEWATPSSGGGVQITFINKNTDTFATVKNAYDAGNLLYMGSWDFPLVDKGSNYFLFQKLYYDVEFSGDVYIYQWKIDNLNGWTSTSIQLATES